MIRHLLVIISMEVEIFSNLYYNKYFSFADQYKQKQKKNCLIIVSAKKKLKTNSVCKYTKDILLFKSG